MNDFNKPVKKSRGVLLPAMIGAMIGGLIVAAIILGVLYATGIIGHTSTTTVSGQKVIVNNDTNVSTQVEAVAQVLPESVVGIQSTVSQQTMFGTQSGTAMGSGCAPRSASRRRPRPTRPRPSGATPTWTWR